MDDEQRQRLLDDDLKRLNANVEAALAKRRAWMDAHMADYARFQVGETLFNMRTGELLGVVSKLYRYWASSGDNPRYDTAMNVEYEFKTPAGYFDNTSRHAGTVWVGTAAQFADQLESKARLARLRGPDGQVEWAKFFPSPEKEPTP